MLKGGPRLALRLMISYYDRIVCLFLSTVSDQYQSIMHSCKLKSLRIIILIFQSFSRISCDPNRKSVNYVFVKNRKTNIFMYNYKVVYTLYIVLRYVHMLQLLQLYILFFFVDFRSKEVIERAIEQYRKFTCIRFKKRRPGVIDYVRFLSNGSA